MSVVYILIIICLILICIDYKIAAVIPLLLLTSLYWCTYNYQTKMFKGGGSTMNILPYSTIRTHVNPEFDIKTITHPKGFNMTLIDEGKLIGGSKQRIIPMVLALVDKKNIIYAGPSTGYAQVALSYICHMMNKQAVLFLDCTKFDKSPLTDIAKKFGADVHYFNPKIREKRLQYIEKQAYSWHKQNKDSYVIPFGLNNDNAIQLYSTVFSSLAKLNPKRIWVVAGSGLIFTSLSKVLTNTKFMIVQVGKKIWPDQLEGINHELFVSDYKFKENIRETPPYDTLLNYDAKVWPFILKHGREGDYVWNTASSPKPYGVYEDELKKIEKMKTSYNIDKYMATPSHALSMPNISTMFNNLATLASEWKPSVLVHRNFTTDYYKLDGISNHFTESTRMQCVVNRECKISPKQFIENNKHKIANKAIFLHGGQSSGLDTNKELLETVGLMGGYRECNSFNPIILINFIKKYFKDYKNVDLLDPSMGWGDRLIASLSLGVKSYTGFDPNINLHPGYKKIAELGSVTEMKFIPEKFSSKELPHQYDVVFTSPPFFNLELYQFSEEDVSDSYDSWLHNMYIPYLTDMMNCVKPGGYVGVYIDNIGKFRTGDDTNKHMKGRLAFVEKLLFQNDYHDFNGILHEGRPRSLWVYTKKNHGGTQKRR